MQTPTILIGLGGTGSQIVDMIYSWIPEDRRNLVAIHAFDTDVNDISKLKNLKKENITQTSTAYTVGQYLNIADKGVKDWFPYEARELHRKTLTDGAGQIRAVSRLAYRAAMEANALESLQHSISKINRLRQDNAITNVRVMIVTSLAGGTGAGIFLQTAMYIRELFRASFNMENILIRGAFILPDTLILNSTVDQNEYDNLRSNAYACLKELNGIYRSISENNRNVQIELEYKPDQNDDHGRRNLTLSFNNLPYDYCVLFDYENEDGRNINSFNNYKRLVARNTYFDLFTPISQTLFSRQDNQIRDLVREGGLNRFCASGIATLSYPYHDIVKYHTLKWVNSFLSDQWLVIDEKVNDDRRDYDDDVNKGINREEFNYGQRFIKNIDELKNEKPFFRRVHKEVHIIDERGNPVNLKSEAYIEAISSEVEAQFTNDEKLKSLGLECIAKEEDLRDKRTMIREVSRVENSLKTYKEEVIRFIQNNKSLLSDKMVTNDARSIIELGNTGDYTVYNCNQPFQLNYWMLNVHEPINPISVRYSLYYILNSINLEIGVLTKEVNGLDLAIKNYEEKAYDLHETEDKVETAEDRARLALKQSFINRIASSNERKLFIEDFLEKSSGQLNRLNSFKSKKLKLEVLQNMYISIKDLSNDFERYFNILSSIKTKITRELNHFAKIHQEHDDPSVVYCFASSENKNTQWESIKSQYTDEGIPTFISKQIYMGLFHRLCKRKSGIYTSDIQEKSIEDEFRNTVVNWCNKKLYAEERLDITIFEALIAEAQYGGVDENGINQYVKDRIQALNTLAKPYTLNPLAINLPRIGAWGINLLVNNQFTPILLEEAFAGGDEIIKDNAFSKYEIVKESLLYGLKAEDLIKFKEPGGAYYRAYNRLINAMRHNSNEITPHLDKRWHAPAYLPSLTDQGIKVEEEKIDKAFIVGLIMGYLAQIDYNGISTWCYKGDGNYIQIINITSDVPVGQHPYQLHEALLYNPSIVDRVLQKYESDIDTQRTVLPDFRVHTFYTGAKQIMINGVNCNVLQVMFSFPDSKPADRVLEEKSYRLLRATCYEIKKYLMFAIGEHRKGTATNEIKSFIEDLKKNAIHYTEAIASGSQTERLFTWDGILNNTEL